MYSNLITVVVLLSTSSSLPITNDALSPAFLRNENETLSMLFEESNRTGNPFKGAWEKSELAKFYKEFKSHEEFESKDLNRVYRLPETLNLGEIRILICYCYKKPPFFQHLNNDLRDNSGLPHQYPVATKVLKGAITKLMEHQIGTNQSLPGILYRNEPDSVFSTYQNLFKESKNGVLKQFTSTSRSYDKAKEFNTDPNRMVISFEDPRLGADVDDFSIFDEFEILLPVLGSYTVQNATKDGNTNYTVVLSGPISAISGHIKQVGNMFMVFLSVLTIKLV